MNEQAVTAPTDIPVAEAVARLAREGRPGAFDTDRYRLRYALWGSGPPIVFVHGICDLARSFAMVAAELSRDFTCILYELPNGRGDGAKMRGYRHRHFSADLFALLDHLNLPRTYLFGSSFGSTIALRAASEHPDRFARMVLQGGFARRPIDRWETVLCQFARYAPGRMKHLVIGSSLKSPGDAVVMSRFPKERRRFMLSNCGNAPIAATAQIALLISTLDLRPLLSGVQLPVRLIGGDSDGIVPHQFEDELLKGLPMVERMEIADCGHLPQYTHPGLLAELIRQFFTPECGREPHNGCSAH